ncbi:MAG TPA: redoxin domain-containing protein [Gaiellales bacterium]|nr:redoxin domain-containing protein [Gaiellales bacterium]
MAERMPQFTLPLVGGGPVSLATLVEDGPRLLVFAHADCPTSHLALRHLAELVDGPVKPVLIAEEPPERAARMARRSGIRFPVLAQEAPFVVSEQFGIEAVPTAVLVDRSSTAVDSLVGWDRAGYERLLGGPLPDRGPSTKPGCGSRLHEPAAEAGLDELEDMFERGWTDGLPVVPPTPERVERMLGGRDPGRSLGTVPPSGGSAALERVAACAVLAGCRPEYFPVVEAAVEAALDPALNPHGLAVTTQPGGVVMVVNGPARERLGLNTGMGALGPGTRANMTIGRALRLVLTLTGGALPGRLDRSTLGSPAKLGLCIAEDEEGSPWEPLHVERGLEPAASAVTVVAADAPLSISDHRSTTPDELASVFAEAAAVTWSPFWWPMPDDSLFVIGPEHAAMFAAAGWSKERLRDAIFAAAVRPAGELRRGETTPAVRESPDDRPIHKWTDPSRILIVVAGGEAGRYSAVLGPCDGMQTQPVTREVRWTT